MPTPLAWLVLGLAAVGGGSLVYAAYLTAYLLTQRLSSHRKKPRHVPRVVAETREMPRYRPGVVRPPSRQDCSPTCPYRPRALHPVPPADPAPQPPQGDVTRWQPSRSSRSSWD